MAAVEEVILRDFDGTETIYPAELPLAPIIRTADTDAGIMVTRRYIKSEETDRLGRKVFRQNN
jgi:hypothetical protein